MIYYVNSRRNVDELREFKSHLGPGFFRVYVSPIIYIIYEVISVLIIYMQMKYQDFFPLLKNHIFIARSEDTILFFTCEDIGVAMVTNMIS